MGCRLFIVSITTIGLAKVLLTFSKIVFCESLLIALFCVTVVDGIVNAILYLFFFEAFMLTGNIF